jgi:hypothetical protein
MFRRIAPRIFLVLTLFAGSHFIPLRAQTSGGARRGAAPTKSAAPKAASAPAGAFPLKADSATTKEIKFSWTGNPAGECSLQKKTGPAPGTWPGVATSSNGKANDAKIAAYATNVYRVACGAKISNEVTVGPPPSGFHAIAARPADRPDTSLGRFITATLDANGDPAIAFVYNDPNGDGKADDTQLMFTAWDRAAYKWREPVAVWTIGNFDPRPPAPCLSLTRDAQTGAYGIAWVNPEDHKNTHMAVSHDDGATWTVKTAFNNQQTTSSPSLAFFGGKAFLTLEQDKTMQIIYTSGGIDEDPYQWHGGFAPMLPGNNAVSKATSLALDETGAPAIAYWQKPGNSNVWTLTFWRLEFGGAARDAGVNPPPNVKPIIVTDTGTSNYPPDGVILTFAGTQPRIMLDSRLDKATIPSHYSTISNDGGSTWSAPVNVPDDGNQHLGGYMSFAVTKDGHAAFAGDVAGGNFQNMKCSWPKLARSTNFSSWTTCAPQGAQYPMVRTLWGTVIYSPSGMLYLFFQARQTNPAQGLPAGVLVWGGQ